MRTGHPIAWLFVVCTLSSCLHDLDVDRRIPYARPEGHQLRLNVYQAQRRPSEPLPAIVAIHGGAWLHGPRVQQWWYIHEFARRGYVVFAVDYRTLPRHGFPHCLHDVKSAVRWVRLHADEYGVDPERIYAFGASAGGHLAAFLATTDPLDGFEGDENLGASSEIGAAISLYGAVDLTKYRDASRLNIVEIFQRWYIWHFVKNSGCPEGEDPFVYASPISYARPSSKPVFFVHGESDLLVQLEQSVDAHARLQELGVPTELVLFDNRGHGFDYIFRAERRRLFAQMLRFLETHGGALADTKLSPRATALPDVDEVCNE